RCKPDGSPELAFDLGPCPEEPPGLVEPSLDPREPRPGSHERRVERAVPPGLRLQLVDPDLGLADGRGPEEQRGELPPRRREGLIAEAGRHRSLRSPDRPRLGLAVPPQDE